jgi:hypothetical protein
VKDEARLYRTDTSPRDALRLAAHNIIRNAIRSGRLLPPKNFICVDCGEPAWGYEHRDYRKPLEVEPVCQACNNRRGPALPEITSDDCLTYKTAYKLRTGVANVGQAWSALSGGEGFSPLEYLCHLNVNDYESWWLDDDGRKTNRQDPDAQIYNRINRYEFFKQHDPLWLDESAYG